MKKVLFLFAIVIMGCSEKEKTKSTELSSDALAKDVSGNLNVSILLDLSDRIDPEKYPNAAMPYHERDAGYINSVAQAFSDHLKTKKVKQINDRMQLYFEPAPGNPNINAISNKLRISFTKDNISKEKIVEMERNYAELPSKLYNLAIKDGKYVGSDIWRFFKNKVDDCNVNGYRNVLVILTDGYIYYQNTQLTEGNKTSYLTPERIRDYGLNTSNWLEKFEKGGYGYINANDNLSGLEILVLGVNPSSKNQYEEDVIKAYWSKWLTDMKVGRYEIRNAELPSDVDEIIKDFVTRG